MDTPHFVSVSQLSNNIFPMRVLTGCPVGWEVTLKLTLCSVDHNPSTLNVAYTLTQTGYDVILSQRMEQLLQHVSFYTSLQKILLEQYLLNSIVACLMHTAILCIV